MEWVPPEHEVYELSAEMTAYAGHWAEADEVEREEEPRDGDDA